MKEEKILSFTSHKARLPLIDGIFRGHLEVARACDLRVCFSCQDDSLPYMTEYQKSLVSSGEVELLHVPKDHGSNTKWTLCRAAHPNATMIVVDDDWIYDIESIKSLLETHRRYPDAIVCRAYRTIPWVGCNIPNYEVKPLCSYPKTIVGHIHANLITDCIEDSEIMLSSGDVFPEHMLGILYPPQFPSCSVLEIPQECYRDDDVFIGAMAAAESRKIVFAGRHYIALDSNIRLPDSLWSGSCASNGSRTYSALKTMQSAFRMHKETSVLGTVVLMTCKKYPQRRDSIKQELGRLGIDYVESFDDGSVRPDIKGVNNSVNRCHLAKYMALKKALSLASGRITIMEDDVRFLRNVKEVSDAVNSIPKDFGVCRLNWGVSPFIRREVEDSNPKLRVEIEKEMSKTGIGWVKCPWASCDGCTIMSYEVAKRLFELLETRIETPHVDRTLIDNSDDMVCRICSDLGKPIYAYKPLVCIQIELSSSERGKSSITKFLMPNKYYVPGVVHDIKDYSISQSCSKPKSTNGYKLSKHCNSVMTKPKVYYGQHSQTNTKPVSKGWNW